MRPRFVPDVVAKQDLGRSVRPTVTATFPPAGKAKITGNMVKISPLGTTNCLLAMPTTASYPVGAGQWTGRTPARAASHGLAVAGVV